MWKMNALSCGTRSSRACGWEDAEHMWRSSEHPDTMTPPCPWCGGDTRWNPELLPPGERAPAAKTDNFPAFRLGDEMVSTRSRYQQIKREYEAQNPGKSLVINHQSKGAQRASREEQRHRQWESRKRRGIDPAMVKQHDKARAAGDPVARNNSLTDLAAGRTKDT